MIAPDDPAQLIAAGARFGKYEIAHRIAYGGMAEIYLARVSGIHGFEKHVVLKRILPQYAAREDFVKMFLREARLAATLDQANIAHVHDIGEVGGSYFYTMEYLHGEDLRRIMRELGRRKQPLPIEHALGVVIGVASGLHHAHEKKGTDGRSLGIVHRDISPSNVVVTFDGGVKVVDFGIAKITSDPDLSRGYSPKGKLAYMSPEQLRSQPVDRRSDVFSLGVVLFEITTQSRLFKATTEIEVMRLLLEGNIPAPSSRDPSYPPALERIVMRALEKDPARRYPTARDLQRDLETFAADHQVQISSGAMAEWMERTFGPKREAWHGSLSAPVVPPATATAAPASATAAPATPRPPETEDATRVIARAGAHPPAQVRGGAGVAADIRGEPSVATVGPPEQRRRRPIRSAAVVALVAGGGLLAAVSGVLLLARGRPVAETAPAGATAAAAPVVMLVAEGGNIAVEPARAAPAPAAPAIAAPALPQPLAPSARAPVVAARAAGRRSAAKPAAAGQGLSAALARRQSEIRKCLTEGSAQAAEAAEISFRFEIGSDGRVTSARVLPEAVGATPLGACLAKVAAGTVFPPQPGPVTFRIPLSLRVQVGDRVRR